MDSRELLTRGIAEVVDRAHLGQHLSRGRPLRVKFGIDPTGAQLHLGHAVPLRVLRRWQDLGHVAVLIIGDYTASIGDPSGRTETRPPLSDAAIKKNYATYERQAFKIIDQKRTEVRWQSEWFKKFSLKDLIGQAAQLSVGWILSHETFRDRAKNRQPLAFHELFYPLLQAYDSVAVKADVEVGGLDQKFNLLTGRELMRAHGLPPQDVVLTKYLIGTDGQKMGKSLNNFIALEEEPFEMFGKIMSLPDTVLRDYFELATDVALADFEKMHWSGAEARNTKMFLARKIVEEYHGVEKSNEAMRKWEDFREGKTDGRTVEVKFWKALRDVVVNAGYARSNSDAQRLFEQGAVYLDGKIEKDWRKNPWDVGLGWHQLVIGKKKRTVKFLIQALPKKKTI
ncbi:MAG: tyrosine--tRNA ligase [Candidatus Kerfeldbacteria bacterium]|nr:tyrosine--tRNA ligase [Candidatus Kerfeldbacteria bacterium]